jgi:hypothetical protein
MDIDSVGGIRNNVRGTGLLLDDGPAREIAGFEAAVDDDGDG